jgi:hypothetical protein
MYINAGLGAELTILLKSTLPVGVTIRQYCSNQHYRLMLLTESEMLLSLPVFLNR